MAKVYAVKAGRRTGLFSTWAECEASVKGYSGASYKSFKTKKEAEAWLFDEVKENLIDDMVVCYVDGSYEASTGRYSYGLCYLYKGEYGALKGVGDNPDWQSHRNVAGEILGAIKAFELTEKLGAKGLVLHYDYMGIAAWAKGEWRANLPLTKHYQALAKAYFDKFSVTFVKVKAHSGNNYNDRADKLAKQALEESHGNLI